MRGKCWLMVLKEIVAGGISISIIKGPRVVRLGCWRTWLSHVTTVQAGWREVMERWCGDNNNNWMDVSITLSHQEDIAMITRMAPLAFFFRTTTEVHQSWNFFNSSQNISAKNEFIVVLGCEKKDGWEKKGDPEKQEEEEAAAMFLKSFSLVVLRQRRCQIQSKVPSIPARYTRPISQLHAVWNIFLVSEWNWGAGSHYKPLSGCPNLAKYHSWSRQCPSDVDQEKKKPLLTRVFSLHVLLGLQQNFWLENVLLFRNGQRFTFNVINLPTDQTCFHMHGTGRVSQLLFSKNHKRICASFF